LAEVEQLKLSIAADLEGILKNSKTRYYPNLTAPACKSNKCSIHFAPPNDDDKDAFIDLLTDELLLPGYHQQVDWRIFGNVCGKRLFWRISYGDTLRSFNIAMHLMVV
jgi:hypothetical protein